MLCSWRKLLWRRQCGNWPFVCPRSPRNSGRISGFRWLWHWLGTAVKFCDQPILLIFCMSKNVVVQHGIPHFYAWVYSLCSWGNKLPMCSSRKIPVLKETHWIGQIKSIPRTSMILLFLFFFLNHVRFHEQKQLCAAFSALERSSFGSSFFFCRWEACKLVRVQPQSKNGLISEESVQPFVYRAQENWTVPKALWSHHKDTSLV